MNFSDIRNEIQDTLARTDTTVTNKIGTWVNRRQRLAAARHNFGFMRSNQQYIITSGGTYPKVIGLEDLFKDDAVFYLHKTSPAAFVELEVKPLREMLHRYTATDSGEPKYVSYERMPGTPPHMELWVWPPVPDQAYTMRTTYYLWPADLDDSSNPRNWFTENFPGVLIAGGVADGLRFLGAHEEAAFWEGGQPPPGSQRESNPAAFEPMLKQAIQYDVGLALPQEFVLTPRWDSRGTTTARREAGWPWG